jgi:hypothetical protein
LRDATRRPGETCIYRAGTRSAPASGDPGYGCSHDPKIADLAAASAVARELSSRLIGDHHLAYQKVVFTLSSNYLGESSPCLIVSPPRSPRSVSSLPLGRVPFWTGSAR